MFIRGDLVVSSSDTQNNAQPIFSVFLAQESHLIWRLSSKDSSFFFSFFSKYYLLVCLHRVLVAAHGTFGRHCRMRDL